MTECIRSLLIHCGHLKDFCLLQHYFSLSIALKNIFFNYYRCISPIFICSRIFRVTEKRGKDIA